MEGNISDLIFYFDEANGELFVQNTSNSDEEELVNGDKFEFKFNNSTSKVEINSVSTVPTGWEGPFEIDLPESDWNDPIQFAEVKVPYMRYQGGNAQNDVEVFDPSNTEKYVVGSPDVAWDNPSVTVNTEFFELTPTGIILEYDGDKMKFYYPKQVSGKYVHRTVTYTY